MRHAPHTTGIDVVIATTASETTVTVSNDGVTGAPNAGGYGIQGLRERADHVGGTREAGPAERGRWRVHGASAVGAAATLDPGGRVTAPLMDVRMPRTDGIAATARIVAEMPTTRVLVLTTFDLDEYAFGALDAGASGFLLKDARRDELTAAVRAIHRGDAVLSPRVTRELISRASRRAYGRRR